MKAKIRKIQDTQVLPQYVSTYTPNNKGGYNKQCFYRLWAQLKDGTWVLHPLLSDNKAYMAQFHIKVHTKGSIDLNQWWTYHVETSPKVAA